MKIQKSLFVADVTGEQVIIYFLTTNVCDMGDAQKIVDEVEDIVTNREVKLVVVNFGRVQQMTSTFLGKLIALNRSLSEREIKVRLCCMSATLERAYKICKLQKIMPLYNTEKKALSG